MKEKSPALLTTRRRATIALIKGNLLRERLWRGVMLAPVSPCPGVRGVLVTSCAESGAGGGGVPKEGGDNSSAGRKLSVTCNDRPGGVISSVLDDARPGGRAVAVSVSDADGEDATTSGVNDWLSRGAILEEACERGSD
jgi:hypothetical protein